MVADVTTGRSEPDVSGALGLLMSSVYVTVLHAHLAAQLRPTQHSVDDVNATNITQPALVWHEHPHTVGLSCKFIGICNCGAILEVFCVCATATEFRCRAFSTTELRCRTCSALRTNKYRC